MKSSNQFNPLTEQQSEWVAERSYFFTGLNRTLTKSEAEELFAIYSWVTGKNQRYTACGRCVASAKATVWKAYQSRA